MSLLDHARAARILGETMLDRANKHGDASGVMSDIAMGYMHAADRMEAEARADIAAIGGGCTLDHSVLKAGVRCPACQK